MKRFLVLATLLTIVALSSAPAFAMTWTNDFVDAADMAANWTAVNGAYLMTLDAAANAPGSTGGSAASTLSGARIYHNLGTGGVGTGYFSASWSIYDGSMTRAFGEMESRAGGAYTGALQQIFAAGKYNNAGGLGGEVWDATKYQGRLLYGANTGWFNLNAPGAPSRSAGWHKFTVERLADGSTVNWYVDDILSKTVTGANNWDMNVVALGFGTNSTSNGTVWFDEVSITNVVPEPGSMLALGTGLIGLFGMIRRKRA